MFCILKAQVSNKKTYLSNKSRTKCDFLLSRCFDLPSIHLPSLYSAADCATYQCLLDNLVLHVKVRKFATRLFFLRFNLKILHLAKKITQPAVVMVVALAANTCTLNGSQVCPRISSGCIGALVHWCIGARDVRLHGECWRHPAPPAD